MPQWAGSDRRSRLPANWSVLRKRILRRDGYQCTHRDEDGVRCTEIATDVDHIRPGDDHSELNLRSLCGGHHRKKSSSEGAAAAYAKRKKIANSFKRYEGHPGSL